MTAWDGSAPLRIGPAHEGPINAVATVHLDDGRTLIVSAGDDGLLRRWDAVSGRPVGEPLRGHTGWVWAVSTVRLEDGRTLIVSAGADRVLRRWDAVSGEPVGEPLRGHTGWVWAVSTVRLEDGRTLIVSAGADGLLRRWDAVSGEPVGEPLTGHTGWVWAVSAVRLEDGRTLIVSAGDDWSVILWPLRPNGQVADEPIPAPRARALSVVDDENVSDALNRGVLTAHLEALLVQLTAGQRAGTAVVHIDGRWGAGKSTLVNLLVERLDSSQRPTDESAAEQAGADEPAPQRLTDPVVVRYDAWRESTVAPEWWSLARSINVAVRSHRALATRVAMTVAGAVTRTARSRPVLVAGAVLVATLLVWASGVGTCDARTVGTDLTTVATLTTVGLALSRVLFWASPAFGRLHQRADDNPLGEIAALVASLRRWSPRGVRGHRSADTLLALTVGAGLAGYLAAVRTDPATRSTALAGLRWIEAHAAGLGAAAVVTLLVVGCWRRAPARRPAPQPRVARPRPTRPGSRLGTHIWRVALLVVAAAGAYVAVSPGPAARWLSSLRPIQQYPGWWAAGVVLGGVGLYALWTLRCHRHPRRPIVLVIDDLDRCSAERVVKLMETVHTLLREPAEPRLLPGWRRPAPLVVLVLADGRWVRTAFETSYESFGALGSPVHGLGADFLQKVFDHTVLVPALAADQVQTYVDHLTGTSPWAVAGRARAGQNPDLSPAHASSGPVPRRHQRPCSGGSR